MIDKIFAAPKSFTDEDPNIAFVIDNHLGYEIPTFSHAETLMQKDQVLDLYKMRYKTVPGWLSLQGPTGDVNPISADPEIAMCSLNRCSQAIDAAKELGAKYVIFQSMYTPARAASSSYHDWLTARSEFWLNLIEEQLRSTDIVLLLSNCMEDDPGQILDLTTRISSPRLKICLDVAWIHLFSRKPAIDWLDAIGNSVEYVRISNHNGRYHTRHAFEEGVIPLDIFLNHMALLPQRLHLSIDVNNLEDLASSYRFIKPYLEMQEVHATTKSLII